MGIYLWNQRCRAWSIKYDVCLTFKGSVENEVEIGEPSFYHSSPCLHFDGGQPLVKTRHDLLSVS